RRAEAIAGVVVGAPNLVAGRCLPADAELRVRLLLFIPDAAGGIGFVDPRVGIVGVLVPEESRHVVFVHVVPGGTKEPDLVPEDRAAEGWIDVPVRLDLVRRSEAPGNQVV